MDLSGLGAGLLDKIEEHWGKRVSRTLTFLITLAAIAGCVALIWQWLLSPLLTFFKTPLWGHTILQLALTTAAIGLGIAFSFSVGVEIEHWRRLQKAKRLIAEIRAEGNELIARAESDLSKTSSTLSSALSQTAALQDDFKEDAKKVRRLFAHLSEGVRRLMEKGVYTDEETAQIGEDLAAIEADLESLVGEEHISAISSAVGNGEVQQTPESDGAG